MTALVRCPLCGANEGYEASGDIMTCCSCLRGRVVVSRTHDEDVAEWNSAGAHAQGLRDRIVALEKALRALVDLKDMRSRLTQLHEMGHGTDYADYNRLQPLAWDSAREVLRREAAPEQKP